MSCPYGVSNPRPSRPQPNRGTNYTAPASRTFPDTLHSSPQTRSLFLEDTFQYYAPIYAQIFQVVGFLVFIRRKCSFTSYLLVRDTFTTHIIPLHFLSLSSVSCRAQIMKFLIMQSRSPSLLAPVPQFQIFSTAHYSPTTSNYIIFQFERPSFTPIWSTKQQVVTRVTNFIVFGEFDSVTTKLYLQ